MHTISSDQVLADRETDSLGLCHSFDIDEHGQIEEQEMDVHARESLGRKFVPAAGLQTSPNRKIQYRRIGLEASLTLWEDLVTRDALLIARMLVRSTQLNHIDVSVYSFKRHTLERQTMSAFVVEKLMDAYLHSAGLESDRFYQSERAIEELPLGSPLALVLSMWCLDKCNLDTQLIDPIFDRFKYGNHIRYIQYKDAGEFVVEKPGASLRDAGVGWFARSTGQPLRSMPDQEYGKWTAQVYQQCMEVDEPKLHRISADIQWSPLNVVKRDYLRLTIPYEDAQGNRSLFCAMSDIEF